MDSVSHTPSRPDHHHPAERASLTEFAMARGILRGLRPAFGLLLLGSFTTFLAAAGRPNVLFIVSDDLNTRIGPSGYQHIDTPHLDRLAAGGMTFSRAYCQYPQCAASRASFLTGLYPETTRVLMRSPRQRPLSEMRPGTLTLPAVFRRAGYWTASVGKVFHQPGSDPEGNAWDVAERFYNDPLPSLVAGRAEFEKEYGAITPRNREEWNAYRVALGTQHRGQKRPGYGPSGLTDAQHSDGKNARRVAQWLKTRAHGERPFFIALGIQKPHVPFLAPDRYFRKYPTSSIAYSPPPADVWEGIPDIAATNRYRDFGFELGVENEPRRRAYTQAYHACISFIDAQIGLVLDALETSGHGRDTIVVFFSDHGYHLGEHFMWGKKTLFEVCARVPLIVRVPGKTRPGTRTDGLVELVDLFPTLTELSGVPAPSDIQGRSFAHVLSDPDREGKEYAYTVTLRGRRLGRAIRFDRWRYAEWRNPQQNELYDLKDDPGELINLATQPKHDATVQRARVLLRKAARVASGR